MAPWHRSSFARASGRGSPSGASRRSPSPTRLFGPSPGILGPSWGPLGGLLGSLGAVLGASSAVFERSWGPLGPPWGGHGGLLGKFGASEARKGENPKNIEKNNENQRFWHIWAVFGGLLEASWGVLEASWAVWTQSWASGSVRSAIWGSLGSPKRPQEPPRSSQGSPPEPPGCSQEPPRAPGEPPGAPKSPREPPGAAGKLGSRPLRNLQPL